jgi:hypothetical protein
MRASRRLATSITSLDQKVIWFLADKTGAPKTCRERASREFRPVGRSVQRSVPRLRILHVARNTTDASHFKSSRSARFDQYQPSLSDQ